jgi:hypothetical protein
MSHELLYTSAPKGLQLGSRGFCTVAATRGIPAALVEKLETLSGYRPLFPPHDPKAPLNPVVHAHLRINIGGKAFSVLSRICAAGLDYTDRANKFAHHVVLEANELPAGGPAWLLGQPEFMESRWDGEVKQFPSGRLPPRGDSTVAICRAWGQVTGDPGWAGVLAESFQHDPNRLVYIIFEPGTDPLELLTEALALLPPAPRWDVTFSTYFTGLPQGTLCLWRCVARDSIEAKAAHKLPNALVLDLTRHLGQACGGACVSRARGEIAAPANGSQGEDVLMERTARVRAPGLSATAMAVAERSASDYQPPPVPAVGRSRGERARSWFPGTVTGVAIGVLVSAGLVGVGYYSGVLRLSENAELTENNPNGRGDAAAVRFPNAGADEAEAQVARLNKKLDEVGKENDRLKDEQARAARESEMKRKELERQIAVLQQEVAKAAAKPVDPPKRVAKDPTEQLQSLFKSSRNGQLESTAVGEELAKLDAKIYGWVAELDKVRAAFAPKTIAHYSRLPRLIGSRDSEVTLPPELKDRQEKKDWTLHLLGLKGLKQKSDEHRLKVVQEITNDKDTVERPIAHFQREGNRLSFQWDNGEERAEDVRRAVRNAVLEISREQERFRIGLMRATSDPKVTFPLTFEYTKDLAPSRTLERNKEERLSGDLFLGSVRCELGNQMRVLRALTDTAKLEWPGQVLIRFTKKDDRPGECQLTAQWIGDPPMKPARFVIHSLMAYTVVEGHRVEVWNIGETDKKK